VLGGDRIRAHRALPALDAAGGEALGQVALKRDHRRQDIAIPAAESTAGPAFAMSM